MREGRLYLEGALPLYPSICSLVREGGGYIWRGVTALSLNMFTGEGGGGVIFGGGTTALSLNMFTGEGGGR